MGDRTTVTITLRGCDFKALIDKEYEGSKAKFDMEMSASEINERSNGRIEIIGHEINYGEWEELESILTEHNIDYDKSWDAGDEYEAGNAYIRGDKKLEIYDGERRVLMCLAYLKSVPPNKVLQVIEEEYKKIKPFEPAPLDEPNSVKFIKDK